ncbi:hypothetical protein L228DRAFT_275155 [Xylona heveae TC161]|uniref:Uncharacterized protein n=1 Tax=Xylona heveae (strain CBS 132557 / TC161) TaxID=1328760 RepID=A0A165J6Q3_XYLHT|nr:hypothetical protein L228DRAFT_275155 [Xylona heveae TC161]KZF25810.1 hypothetical protein L228DRAFT_275155 [Xylona heveae TC161]
MGGGITFQRMQKAADAMSVEGALGGARWMEMEEGKEEKCYPCARLDGHMRRPVGELMLLLDYDSCYSYQVYPTTNHAGLACFACFACFACLALSFVDTPVGLYSLKACQSDRVLIFVVSLNPFPVQTPPQLCATDVLPCLMTGCDRRNSPTELPKTPINWSVTNSHSNQKWASANQVTHIERTSTAGHTYLLDIPDVHSYWKSMTT